MPHPQESDPRTADPSAPLQSRPPRGPWWVVGRDAVGAGVFLAAQAALLWVFVARIVSGDGQWWEWLAALVAVATVAASVASIVYFARRR